MRLDILGNIIHDFSVGVAVVSNVYMLKIANHFSTWYLEEVSRNESAQYAILIAEAYVIFMM